MNEQRKLSGAEETAVEKAYQRATSGFPYAAEYWAALDETLGHPEYVKNPYNRQQPVQGIDRYHLIYEELKKSGITQWLELASGQSTMCLHYCKNNKDAKCVEVLLKDEADLKKEVYQKIGRVIGDIPENLHVLDGDVTEKETFEKALKHFDCNKPVAVISAGLFPYLSPEEKEQTVENIKNLFDKFGGRGKWFTPDFGPPFPKGHQDKLEKQTGKPLNFLTGEETRALFEKKGLSQDNVVSLNKRFREIHRSFADEHYAEVTRRGLMLRRAQLDNDENQTEKQT